MRMPTKRAIADGDVREKRLQDGRLLEHTTTSNVTMDLCSSFVFLFIILNQGMFHFHVSQSSVSLC